MSSWAGRRTTAPSRYTGTPTWFESVGGDGGQSGFDVGNPTIRYHNYFDATPEVNFHGNDPTEWLDIYDPLQATGELRSFYVPFIADPTEAGRAFIGLEHVWRTDANGGDPAYLEAHCNALHLDPNRKACGDWKPMGLNLTGSDFGNFRVGHYVVATTRAPSDAGTLWAGTRIGRLFVTSNANDSAAAQRAVGAARHAVDARPVRLRDRGRPDRPEPRLDLVLGLRRVHAGPRPGTCSRPGTTRPRGPRPSRTARTTWATSRSPGSPSSGRPATSMPRPTSACCGSRAARRHWENAGTSLPSVAVYGLTLSQSAHVLYAATHGRGAYVLSLPTS